MFLNLKFRNLYCAWLVENRLYMTNLTEYVLEKKKT